MAEIEKMNLESEDLVEDRLAQLKELMPEVFTESGIDFDKLRLELGDEVDEGQERYAFTWPGRMDAIRQSQTPSTATLRPCVEKSRGRDGEDGSFDSDNIYIEGDNLEVLKLLQSGYHGKVKMIYIDPPYNTGHDFVYKDKFGDTIENYKEQAGLAGQSNADTSGRYHSDWCSMMYPRLRLARELLSDDGVIFISIDGNEDKNLRTLCDEVFGETNFRNQLLVRRRIKSLNAQFADNGLNSFNVGSESVFVYSKSSAFVFSPLRVKKTDAPAKGSWNVFWSNADRPTMRYEILGFTPETGQWRWQQSLAEEAVLNYQTYLSDYSATMSLEDYWKKTGRTKRFIRRIENGAGKNGGVQYWVAPSDTALRTSNWNDLEVSQIAKDFDLPFDNPKNVNLIKTIISAVPGSNFLVLDFFSGSSTTADAVARLNVADGGSRRCISIQLPEHYPSDSDAVKQGFETICDVGEERIRRAGDKIKAEIEEANAQPKLGEESKRLPDIGFRVFSLDNSGIEKPQPGQLVLDVVKPDRSDMDIVFEMMLKWGLELTLPVEKEEVAGYPVYSVACGELVCCLADGLTMEVLDAIADMEPRRVLMRDSILTDTLKLNAVQAFRRVEERAGYEVQLRTV